jgi:hypothetical protein
MLRRAGRQDEVIFNRLLLPVNGPADQGLQQASLALPKGIEAGTELVLDIGPGPYGSPAWDWTWLANLRIK